MTHANDIATLTALRDEQDILDVWRSGNDLVQCETEPSRTPEQIAALDSAITALAALEAATGEEARGHAAKLTTLASKYEEDAVIARRAKLTDLADNAVKNAGHMLAGAAAITALAASEAKVKALAEALQSLRKDAYIGATTGVVGCGEMIATIDAAMKEVGHE